MIESFFSGLVYPFRAFAMLMVTPRLWKYVLIPIVLNIILGVTVYAALVFAGFGAIDNLVGGLQGWATFVTWLLRIVLVIGLFLATGFVLVRLGVILGSPWYSQLSSQLEQQLTGQVPPPDPEGWQATLQIALRDIWRTLGFELKKLLVFLPPGLVLLVLNFVPGAGQVIAVVGTVIIGVLVSCLDFFDAPLERRLLGFRQKFSFIRHTMPASLGFGLVCFGLVSIPFVNLLSIPICVTAGTLFFCNHLPELAKVVNRTNA